MNLMWFENFWMVGGVALFFVLVLVVGLFFLALLSMFVFNSSLFSVFNSSFVVLVKFEYILKSSFAVLVVTVLEFIFLFSFSVSLLIVWMFLFSVPVLQVSVSTLPFSELIVPFFAKGSNSGAFAPPVFSFRKEETTSLFYALRKIHTLRVQVLSDPNRNKFAPGFG